MGYQMALSLDASMAQCLDAMKGHQMAWNWDLTKEQDSVGLMGCRRALGLDEMKGHQMA
jgi:hypothetical protein